MAHVAIIPARGGSKRLPGKNIKPLGGKPLIAWTIEAALRSECFERVIVSTDDQDIADVAIQWGAEVPFIRPTALSGDLATSDSVIEHAIDWLELQNQYDIETVTLLQPTSPFRKEKHIKECFALMHEKGADGVVSVASSSTYLELSNKLPSDHSLTGFIDTSLKRTQDMERVYEINGAIYLFKRSLVGSLAKLYAPDGNAFAYIMPIEDSVDIDTATDFLWAEFLIQNHI